MKYHLFRILLLLFLACIIRLYLFSGFVLGDDPSYAYYVSLILKGPYPPIEGYAVFACRPLILFFIALPIYLFGWLEWSFIFPIFIASLVNIILVYIAGNKLYSPLAGWLAALAYLIFPLDAVNATTLTNDIPLSTFIWGGGLVLLFSFDKFDQKKYLFLTLVSGFIVGAAVAIKINAIVAIILFLGVLLCFLWNQLRKGGYKTLIAWCIGWVLANILFCFFLYYLSGDIFAHYHIEKRFNLTYMPSGYIPGIKSLQSFLLLYPKWILGIGKQGHPGYAFLPYGYFFLFFLLCLPLSISKYFKKCRLPALLGLFFLLVMEFAPMQLFPDYVPIHRLPRFLHIASIPSAVTIGIVFAILVNTRSKGVKIFSWLFFLMLIVSSGYWAWAKASFYKDCALDRRWAWKIVKNTSSKKIITDHEMCSYLLFRWGFQPPIPVECLEQIPDSLPKDSIVILDGARRPDLEPNYTNNWRKGRYFEDKYIISEAQFSLKPWRQTNVKIYYIPGRMSNYHHQTSLQGMQKISELDVGNSDSENNFNYTIHQQTWSGHREFSYPDGIPCWDDGRAHRGKEMITLNQLQPNRPLLILKRFDPAVTNQEVKVYFNGEFVGIWKFNETRPYGEWQESSFIIPAERINNSKGTLTFFFLKSSFDINSFYYWFYQPN